MAQHQEGTPLPPLLEGHHYLPSPPSEPCHQLHFVVLSGCQTLEPPSCPNTNVSLLACAVCLQSSFPLSTSPLHSNFHMKLSNPLKSFFHSPMFAPMLTPLSGSLRKV